MGVDHTQPCQEKPNTAKSRHYQVNTDCNRHSHLTHPHKDGASTGSNDGDNHYQYGGRNCFGEKNEPFFMDTADRRPFLSNWMFQSITVIFSEELLIKP